MFKKSYWILSVKKLKSTKVLTIMAILIALKIALSSFYIPVFENLRVYFTFFISAISACIAGPIGALISGFISDILGFIIHPSGPFFPGYTLSSMLGALIYALFLFNTKITVVKLGLAKVLVNYGVNVLLGSLWSAMLYSKGYVYYFVSSIIKNTILLPFEIILLVVLFNFILPYLQKKNLVIKQDSKYIPLI